MLIIIRVKIAVIIIFPVPLFSSIRLDDSLCKDFMISASADFVTLTDLGVFVSSRMVAVATDR